MATLAISPFIQSIVTGGVFSSRRLGAAADATTPVETLFDYDMAGGQGYRVAVGITNAVRESKNAFAENILKLEKKVEALNESNKIAKGAIKTLEVTSDYMNPIIGALGAYKVITSDRPEDAIWEEGLAFGGMLAGESAASKIMGMSKTKKVDGKRVVIEQEGLYKKVKFLDDTVKKLEKSCLKSKYAKPALKGGLFIAASIGSSLAGRSTGEWITGSNEQKRA